ncbi:deoxyribose-phosphate aldolase [bacterium CPR1]|nr:deoxyribose-phosphate aldolase [bacterium CPR1]
MQQLDSRSDDPRVPPPTRHVGRSDKTCYKRATGECAGAGCCAELIPQDVRAIVHSGAERVGNLLGGRVVHSELARLIDHTLLKPDATRDQVMLLCQEARENLFASVCINPSWVALCAEQLRGSGVKVCTVVGFPLGATTTVTKVMETRDAVANGADEIDMVVNVAALKDGQDGYVEQDIREVVGAASGRIVKVILETALLSDEEVVRGCHLSKRAGADFVKTSTGFGPGGATSHHVALMRKTVGPTMGVKASGGIRDLETAQEMVKAGATRIGASASVKIVRGEKGTGTY